LFIALIEQVGATLAAIRCMSHGAFVIVGFIAAWTFAFWYDNENARAARDARPPVELDQRVCPRPAPLLAMHDDNR
jgi:hypothetical protein